MSLVCVHCGKPSETPSCQECWEDPGKLGDNDSWEGPDYERPPEPFSESEDPEQWCRVLAWEEQRADKLQARVERYKLSLEACGWEDKGGELVKPPVADCSAWVSMNKDLQAEVERRDRLNGILLGVIGKMNLASHGCYSHIISDYKNRLPEELRELITINAKAEGGPNE